MKDGFAEVMQPEKLLGRTYLNKYLLKRIQGHETYRPFHLAKPARAHITLVRARVGRLYLIDIRERVHSGV